MKLQNSQSGRNKENLYRIGDALLLTNKVGSGARKQILHSINDNTIGKDYVLNSKEDEFGDKLNINLLNSIIDEHIKRYNYPIPNKNSVIIHWRLYPKNPVEHSIIDEKLLKFKYDNIIIVSAMKDSSTRGRENEIFDFINKHNAELKSSHTPDMDFCYCVKANNFISTIGNFSKLIYVLNSGNKQMYKERFYNDDWTPGIGMK